MKLSFFILTCWLDTQFSRRLRRLCVYINVSLFHAFISAISKSYLVNELLNPQGTDASVIYFAEIFLILLPYEGHGQKWHRKPFLCQNSSVSEPHVDSSSHYTIRCIPKFPQISYKHNVTPHIDTRKELVNLSHNFDLELISCKFQV